ncbi:dTDP-4-dehydrorhamnose 3,5-epimerase [Bacillus sp. Marseille-P3661]|uniref:dTDP-4-dehydrorhamnose 3,5-epimerase n=1 Tax=Bacillus sp. Marseille-P3661 TaxID=1936234 RepID=UPI000C840A8B|nr:dTDP-4-dehydrorhamnose 3,5-epimerase [Bacillus sp. Marseille-P3661]
MIIKEGKINGVFEIYLQPLKDSRGYFMRTFDEKQLRNYRIERNWVQENHAFSQKKGTIRGLHLQLGPYSESKLIRVVRGAIMDVFLDLRLNSPTYGKWDSIVLSEENNTMLYIPRGFAHGYCTLTDHCEVIYKVDNYYSPKNETGIIWNDSTLNINWPVSKPILSEKDAQLQTFQEFIDNYQGIALE